MDLTPWLVTDEAVVEPFRPCPRCNGTGWRTRYNWDALDEDPCDTCYGEGEVPV